jgi:2-oxoglutarate ferredoxin oxidoreductase subunit alpha
VRGGPGLGTIQPAQSDYFQSTKGCGHGDYHVIVLAPASVQEMNDFMDLGFELAFKYRNPVLILSDGMIGQMMEKVQLSPEKPRWTDEEIEKLNGSWIANGKKPNRQRHIATSLELDSEKQEKFNEKLTAKYAEICKNEARYEKILCDDAEYLIVAYGSSARICQKTVELAREKGIKVGLLRPITLYPYPAKAIQELVPQLKSILAVEMSTGQMIEDVLLAVNGKIPAKHYGRAGGMIPSPEEVLTALENLIGGK